MTDINLPSDELMEEIIQRKQDSIKFLKEKFPEQFLTVVNAWEHKDDYSFSIPLGLFKCTVCGCIIEHNQFMFSGCCGSCDMGKSHKDREWFILTPQETFKEIPKKTIERLKAIIVANEL